MKKILLLTLSAATLALSGCLSPLERVYLQCKDSGAKQITTGESNMSANQGFFGGVVGTTTSQQMVYDCNQVLARKDVRKKLEDKNYFKGE